MVINNLTFHKIHLSLDKTNLISNLSHPACTHNMIINFHSNEQGQKWEAIKIRYLKKYNYQF